MNLINGVAKSMTMKLIVVPVYFFKIQIYKKYTHKKDITLIY